MAPSKEKQSTNVFIRDEVYGWRPAVQEKINGDKAIVTVPEYPSEQSMACDGGRAAKKGNQVTINLKDYPSGVLPLQNVDANGNLVECADMVKLPYLHEVNQNAAKMLLCVMVYFYFSTEPFVAPYTDRLRYCIT
jgi:hypothetical protein